MTFRIGITLEADGDDARVAVKSVGDEANKTTGAVKSMGTASQKTSGQTKGLGETAEQTKARLKGLTDGARQNAAATAVMGKSSRAAAAQTTNLVAQGNDVMVMMMAGQNPLQLAMQQGTQISQVLGPMGAAGAMKALGTAIVGMLNPISLFTIGGIAAGAAMVNWLRDAKGAGEDYADTLDRVKDALSAYLSLMASKTDHGSASFEADKRRIEQTSQAYEDLIALAKIDAFKSIETSNSALRESVVSASYLQGKVVDTGDLLNIDTQLHGLITPWKENRAQVRLFIDDLNALANAASLDEQYNAAIRVRNAFKSTVDVTGDMTSAQMEFWRNLSQSIYQMELLGAATDKIKTGYIQYYQSRIASEENLASLRASELEQQASIYGLYARTRVESDAAVSSAQAQINTLRDQAALQAVIAKFGADSYEATVLRTTQERLAYAETLQSKDVSEGLKEQLMAAWDAANGLSGVDTAAQLGLAAQQASNIANELARAVDNAISLSNQGVGAANRARINYEFRDDPIGRAGALARADFDARTELPEGADSTLVNTVEKERREFVGAQVEAARYNEQLRAWREAQTAASRKSARGAGAVAKATEQQRKAVAGLIAGLQDEIAILQTSDPVQKELLRNREALSGATDAERQTIASLIAQRDQETQAVEQQAATWAELRSTAYGVFQDLRSSGGDLEQTLASLADRIADMVFQATLLGEGPLANLFGGAQGNAQGGGLIGTLLTAIAPNLAPTPVAVPGRAEGGMIYGKGGPKSDQVLMYGSNGEFMMNAKATAKNRHLLELLNSGGSVPHFAAGGAIDGGAASYAPQINILPMNNSSVPLNMEVEETTGPRGQRQQNLVLSDAVATGLSGGAAKRQMQTMYGARQKGIGRG